MLQLRPYRSSDRAAIYEICVRTADAGGDARGQYSSDDVMPDVYAGPYLEYQPELVTVVVNESDIPLGYVIGVADTADYVRWYHENWLPRFAAKYVPDAAGEQPEHAVSSAEKAVITAGLRPKKMLIAELADYPAHLHIDLLPETQGQGLGRRLIEHLSEQLRERGVPGIHLGFSPRNTAAAAFYSRLGFTDLPSSTAKGPLMGISLVSHAA